MKVATPVQRHSVTLEIELSPIAFRKVPTGHTITFSLESPVVWQKIRTFRGLLALNLETYEKRKVKPDTKVYAIHLNRTKE